MGKVPKEMTTSLDISQAEKWKMKWERKAERSNDTNTLGHSKNLGIFSSCNENPLCFKQVSNITCFILWGAPLGCVENKQWGVRVKAERTDRMQMQARDTDGLG